MVLAEGMFDDSIQCIDNFLDGRWDGMSIGHIYQKKKLFHEKALAVMETRGRLASHAKEP